MPGITAIISKNRNGNETEKINLMMNSMMYEPFYSCGTYINKQEGFFIGFTSNKCSFSDCMPIYNENKGMILFIAGECYFDEEVISDLRKKNHIFDPKNASILIHLYEEYQDDFIKTLNGYFFCIIINLKEKKVVLFNDKYGRGTIYYYENNDLYAFSSEAKSLLKAFPELREIDNISVGESIVYDCVLDNNTYFKNIKILPSSSLLKITKNEVIKKTYFDFSEFESERTFKIDDYIEEYSSAFKKILPRYLKGGSLGLTLTGGTDTRTILSCINTEKYALPCYTFGCDYKDTFDIKIASKICTLNNLDYNSIILDERFFSKYSDFVNKAVYISDGMISVMKSDELFFNSIARTIAPIKISGSFGSELLKKGWFFARDRSPENELINREFNEFVLKAKSKRNKILNGYDINFILSKEIPWWCNETLRIESSQLELRTPYLDNDLVKIVYKAPIRDEELGLNIQYNIIRKNDPGLLAITTTLGHIESTSVIKQYLTKYYIKGLSKFDHYFMSEKLPYSMNYFFLKYFNILSFFHIEKLFFGNVYFRRYNQWFKNQLSGYIKDTLLNEKTFNRPYWNKKYIEKIVYDHIKGKKNYAGEIRKVLQMEIIHRVLIENI
jgi:asparagine synthase (glutamine-hydrolysing)